MLENKNFMIKLDQIVLFIKLFINLLFSKYE